MFRQVAKQIVPGLYAVCRALAIFFIQEPLPFCRVPTTAYVPIYFVYLCNPAIRFVQRTAVSGCSLFGQRQSLLIGGTQLLERFGIIFRVRAGQA